MVEYGLRQTSLLKRLLILLGSVEGGILGAEEPVRLKAQYIRAQNLKHGQAWTARRTLWHGLWGPRALRGIVYRGRYDIVEIVVNVIKVGVDVVGMRRGMQSKDGIGVYV